MVNSLKTWHPRKNPFSPGAGTQPPELAGRDSTPRTSKRGACPNQGKSGENLILLVGLRGVGNIPLLVIVSGTEHQTGGNKAILHRGPRRTNLCLNC